MNEKEFRAWVGERAKEAGGQKNYAAAIGMSQSYLSDIINGKRPISVRFAEKTGCMIEFKFTGK